MRRFLKGIEVNVKIPWQWHIFPKSCPPSIVCAEAFHFRVRDENGWVHLALTTRGLYLNSEVDDIKYTAKKVLCQSKLFGLTITIANVILESKIVILER